VQVLDDLLCNEFGLEHGSGPAHLIELLRLGGRDYMDGILTSEDSLNAAEDSLRLLGDYSVQIVSQVGTVHNKYSKLHLEGETLPSLIALFGDEEPEDGYPTDMENLILWAVIQPGSILGSAWVDTGKGRFLNWRKQLRGCAIVAEPHSSATSFSSSIAAIFGLNYAGMSSVATAAAVAAEASEVHIRAPGRPLEAVQAKLFFEAVTISHPKWRFLSLYRILENAYLSNIKKALISAFDMDATRAVEDAKKKLQSEVNQLISLMTEIGMESEFQSFDAAFEVLLAQGNRYCHALDRNAREEPQYGQGLDKKAVVRFYKMRCSIAHAGTSSVIYEQLSDADSATVALLQSVEAIALRSLGIWIP
jgi:hypothetical protein